MRRISLFVGLAMLIVTCHHRESELDAIQEANDRETSEIVEPLPESVHNNVSLKRRFSDVAFDDEFVLTLSGKDYENATVVFCILNAGHDTLFIRKSQGRDFLSRDEQRELNRERKMEFIQQRMSTFFANTGFSNPPYTLNDPTKGEFPGNLELWDEIKNDSTRWCFEFALQDSGKTELIAYSQKLDTILVYDFRP